MMGGGCGQDLAQFHVMICGPNPSNFAGLAHDMTVYAVLSVSVSGCGWNLDRTYQLGTSAVFISGNSTRTLIDVRADHWNQQRGNNFGSAKQSIKILGSFQHGTSSNGKA